MHPIHEHAQVLTRRHFFGTATKLRVGPAALAPLSGASVRADATPAWLLGAPRAKRAIYLFMNGGPSQLDLWDHKPSLADKYDQNLPASVRGNQRLTLMTANNERFPIAPSAFQFSRQ